MATAVHPTKKKAKCLTISEKLELLEDHASSRMTGSQLATKYSVNKATVSRILAQKQQLRLQCEKRHNLRLKRLPRKTAFQGINSAIEKIILQSSDGGKESALTGPIIQEMAKNQTDGTGCYEQSHCNAV
ncbi:hypothetical protein BV898_18650 [Hypsibius exemplaris]|uniref:HTH psq-type domain-containing protein n=1 Tax=Hypsibius exemplaris TaxID=2072580 RepID=A0A9X6NJ94_HYPEX|nr:hypothetical protein BV898_18650 [Hypsibius exemplaris]